MKVKINFYFPNYCGLELFKVNYPKFLPSTKEYVDLYSLPSTRYNSGTCSDVVKA